MRCVVWVLALCGGMLIQDVVLAQSPGAPYRRLLESGRLPDERVPQLLEMLAGRGDADDLAWLLAQAAGEDGYQGANQLAALRQLAKAHDERRLKPAGDLDVLARLLKPEGSPQVVRQAADLAGQYQDQAFVQPLIALATADVSTDVRQAAVHALGAIGGDAAREALLPLAASGQPMTLRFLGVAGLTSLDVGLAAKQGVQVLAEADASDDASRMIAAFLDRQDGAAQLAAALGQADLEENVAKGVLRYLYSVGRADPALVDALAKAANLPDEPPKPSESEVVAMVQAAEKLGNPHRGEEVYRRKELSCIKCHAVSKAGGTIGPDLSPIGAASPTDYLVTSILIPELHVKEEYRMATVIDYEGRLHRGIIEEESDERIVLRDAEGRRTVIPADPDNEVVIGGSLMPSGLTRFLTEQEFLDLVAYLDALGRPGEFAVRSRPTLQRWRALSQPPAEWIEEVPNEEQLIDIVQQLDADRWLPAYAKTAGALPLGELVIETGSPILYLYSEVQVTRPGRLGLRLDDRSGVIGWIGKNRFPADGEWSAEVGEGTHRLILRIDTSEAAEEITAEWFAPEDSSVEFQTVDGA